MKSTKFTNEFLRRQEICEENRRPKSFFLNSSKIISQQKQDSTYWILKNKERKICRAYDFWDKKDILWIEYIPKMSTKTQLQIRSCYTLKKVL